MENAMNENDLRAAFEQFLEETSERANQFFTDAERAQNPHSEKTDINESLQDEEPNQTSFEKHTGDPKKPSPATLKYSVTISTIHTYI